MILLKRLEARAKEMPEITEINEAREEIIKLRETLMRVLQSQIEERDRLNTILELELAKELQEKLIK